MLNRYAGLTKCYVEQTLLDNGTLGTPKTQQSQRHIPLRPAVIEAFKYQEKRSRLASEFIFPDPNTKARYYNTNLFLKRFKWLLDLAGLRQRAPNQLRHTFVTQALASGESSAWVAQMVGHKDSEITHRKYDKYIPNMTRDDGSALEKALKSHRFGHDMGIVTDK
jgi:integrase